MDGFKIYLLGRTNLFCGWWDIREKSFQGCPQDLWLEHLGGWSVYKDGKGKRVGWPWDQNQSKFGSIMFEFLMNYLKEVIKKAVVYVRLKFREDRPRGINLGILSI